MSTTIVKRLHIKENEVWIDSASSNSSPRSYYYEKCTYWSRMLKEQGQEALDKDILHQYWGGMLRGVPNKWSRAVDRFRKEHPEFTWDNVSDELGVRYGMLITHTNTELKEAMYPYLIRGNK